MSDKPPGISIGSRLIDLPGEPDPDAPPDPEPVPSVKGVFELDTSPKQYLPGKTTQTFEVTNVKLVGHPNGRPSDVPLDEMIAQFKYSVVTGDLARTIQHKVHQWFTDALIHKPYRIWIQVNHKGGTLDIQIQPVRYVHDCMSCTFLGGAEDDEGHYNDLYACTNHSPNHQVTFIARYGSDGAEYTSGPDALVLATGNPVLKEAMRRWEELKGLGLPMPQITQY